MSMEVSARLFTTDFEVVSLIKSLVRDMENRAAVSHVLFSCLGSGEGTHLYIPWVQKPTVVDVRTRWTKIQADTGSKDLQTVHIVLRVLYRPEIAALPTIYRELGGDWEDKILPSVGNEILTATVAQYDAVELITQREQVSQTIREGLIERCNQYHITLDDVSITHLTFSPEYTSAIERKQVAQQEAERSKYLVDRARQEALANTIRAQGESEAARLITQASSPGFVELRRLEASREIAEVLATSPNISYLPSGGSNMLFQLSPGAARLANELQNSK